MNIAKKILFATEEDTTSTVISCLRSDPGVSIDSGTLCTTENANFECFLFSTTTPIVSSGDIVYNTNNQTSPFDGENKYYKLDNGTNTYVVLINNVGELNVVDICLI